MRRAYVSAAVLLLASGACVQILGDDFEIAAGGTEGAGASTGGTSNVGGSGAAGATGGSGGGRAVGEDCSAASECASGNCTDEVCCDTACDGICESCNLDGLQGSCTAHAAASDPDDECTGVCDGARACADGTIAWGLLFGDDSTELNLRGRVAADADGNVATFGDFYGGTVDFGGNSFPITAFGYEDAYLMVADSGGTPLWAKAIGGDPSNGDFASPQDVTFDVAGSVIIAGGFRNRIQFGPFPSDNLLSNGNFDAFVVRLSARGSVLWKTSFGNVADNEFASAVTSDADGNVYVGGTFSNTVDFGGGPRNAGANPDLFLVKLDGNGAHVRSDNYDGLGVRSLDADPGGRVAIGGQILTGSPSIGGPALTGTHFVAVVAPNGNHVWSRGFNVSNLADVALDPMGNLYAVGYFANTVDLGGGNLVSDGDDYFVVKWGPDGTHLWSLVINAAGGEPQGIGVDPAGNVTVASNCTGLQVAGLSADVGASSGACALKIATDGTPLWIYHTVSGSPDTQGVAVADNGRVYVAGRFNTSLDFGLGDSVVTYEGGFVAAVNP